MLFDFLDHYILNYDKVAMEGKVDNPTSIRAVKGMDFILVVYNDFSNLVFYVPKNDLYFDGFINDCRVDANIYSKKEEKIN